MQLSPMRALSRRVSLPNNGRPKRDHPAFENCVSTNHVWRERKETTLANFGRIATQHTSTLCGGCVALFMCVFVCVFVRGSLSTNNHFHPAYYTIFMRWWMGPSEYGK
ncbi:hypothetical protein T01_6453 [Trichinella spiralis]|uniref:Uncharacterized protein n=1 Tax=Trichinella spiralis TaxID=6334 RepID=A0A0V1AJC7_TRISP|nr:hypothetical protein T01_6453 [Trichinella spiralis]